MVLFIMSPILYFLRVCGEPWLSTFRDLPMHGGDWYYQLVRRPNWLRRIYAATMLVVSFLSSIGDGGSSGIMVLPVEIDKIPYPANSEA